LVKVFLCSTYTDLIDERQAVLTAIRELKLQHESMEFFGAKPDRPIDACLAEVAKSNILVLILGHRYGSLVPGKSISFSEAEYQEGQRRKKPCLVYMRDTNVPVLPKDFERDPDKLRALDAFRATLNERHTVAAFRGPADLTEAVRSDLLETIQIVEAERRHRDESQGRRSAFLVELEDIAVSALATGVREALVLSAVRQALAELQGRPSTLSARAAGAWARFKDTLSAFPKREQPWVFFSYAHSDKAIVESVAKELRRLRVRVWVDQQELIPGDSLLTEIQRGLDCASALVFFASEASLKSPWARHELDFFMGKRLSPSGGPPVIPVLLEAVELPALMRDILYIDVRPSDAREIAQRIAAAVHHMPLRRFGKIAQLDAKLEATSGE
jgi:hypothetical protein